MTTALYFRAAIDHEVGGDGRTVEGRAFRWDHPSKVSDDHGVSYYREALARTSTRRTLTQRPGARPLFVEHRHVDGSVGETTFHDSTEGLMFRSTLYVGDLADIARDRLAAGELPAVSVGFRALKTRRMATVDGLLVLRTEVALDELSLARAGQHEGAQVLSVRAVAGTPRLDAARRRLTLLGPER